jgi:hypothetical protein
MSTVAMHICIQIVVKPSYRLTALPKTTESKSLALH